MSTKICLYILQMTSGSDTVFPPSAGKHFFTQSKNICLNNFHTASVWFLLNQTLFNIQFSSSLWIPWVFEATLKRLAAYKQGVKECFHFNFQIRFQFASLFRASLIFFPSSKWFSNFCKWPFMSFFFCLFLLWLNILASLPCYCLNVKYGCLFHSINLFKHLKEILYGSICNSVYSCTG